MGIALDSASNRVVKVEDGSPGMLAGLRERDIVALVDDIAVTVIENGFVVPRSLVTAVIDPTRETLHLTVFRHYAKPKTAMVKGHARMRKGLPAGLPPALAKRAVLGDFETPI